MSKILRFRLHKRPKGLEAFERPSFVGRLQRMRRERQLQWRALMAGAVLICFAAIGWALT